MNFIRIKVFIGLLICINISFAFAENTDSSNDLKYIFSLDMSYAMTSLKYSGFGLGISYEHKLSNLFSIKINFGQMVCFSEIIIVTIDQQLFLYYYPLNKGMDKLYIGLGQGGNILMYPNYTHKGDVSMDAAISITPVLGWKWKITKYLMIDPMIGWKFNMLLTDAYEQVNNYLNGGFQWGIGLKLFFNDK
jgi:hypothetical protein